MANFYTGNELNSQLEKIFEYAQEGIVIISPYIKLHDRFISTLRTKKENHIFFIVLVFGKNEENLTRSMKKEDFDFFKEFPNIEIRYEKRLHAKYYANESSAILTSMNLYNYSQDNNIEFGILTKKSVLGNIAGRITGDDPLDLQAWSYFERVIEQSELLFHNEPQFEDKLLGLKKKYIGSSVKVDKLTEFFENKQFSDSENRKKPFEKDKFETKGQTLEPNFGYCIRTGKQIPFNEKEPLCEEAYRSWSKFGNKDYPEKYCHFSGEPSNGETSFSKPIMRKNWSKAQNKLKH